MNADWLQGLTVGAPFQDAGCSWVAPVTRADGSAAVLKVAMPHMEGRDEIEGLRFWDGNPTVRLLEVDEKVGAMLLERCVPGTPLRALPEREQDAVIAGLLRRLWRPPAPRSRFRPLSEMLEYWAAETLAAADDWEDAGLVREGLRVFEELGVEEDGVVLATDLHAGNVLRAEREPWLVIDPKPFVGDHAYDATQHLFNCRGRLRADAQGTIRRFADMLETPAERVNLWMFARAAAEPRENWKDEDSMMLARALAR